MSGQSRPNYPRPTLQPEFTPAEALEQLGLRGDRLALGLAGLGGAWGPVDQGLARETLQLALTGGIGVFDVAPAYGTAEKLLGEALAGWKGPKPVVSTKVGRLPAKDALDGVYDYSTATMKDSLRRSLDTLGLPAVDLLFLHEPEAVPVGERLRVVEALRQMQADGLTRRLGLGGGDGAGWDGFVESGAFDVVMLFRRLDACILDGMEADVPRVRAAGLATYGASPLHMGMLGARHEEFVRRRPEWVCEAPARRAVQLRSLAERNSLALPALAHRFMFSVAEIDRTVIGARSPVELASALADFTAGPLPAELFEEVCRISR